MSPLFYNDITQLIYELNFYQVELEAENECLQKTQDDLENALAKYINLYNMTPHGYFLLNNNCLIIDVNLAGSTLLGLTKPSLINRCFSRYIVPEHQLLFSQYRQQTIKQNSFLKIELKLLQKDTACFDVELESKVIKNPGTREDQILICITNIAKRKLDEERISQEQTRSQLLSILYFNLLCN
jgi:PAS domain S-box-containing protein